MKIRSVCWLFWICCLTWSCSFFRSKQEISSGSEPDVIRSEVSIEHPQIQSLIEYLQLNGVTQFQKKDNIRTNNTGYIISLPHKIGDWINTGAMFCTLKTKEQDALKNISSTDSTLLKFQKPILVPANGTGIITGINVLQGDYVAEGDILATVSEPASLIVIVNVPYENHQYARVGTRCELILPDGKILPATINGIIPSVDAVSQSQAYFIKLGNLSLPENLNITVRLPHKQSGKAICVSNNAVQADELQKEFWLMKLVHDSIAVKIPVRLGLRNNEFTEVISPMISISDAIINEGAYELSDSSLVIVK
ncbi:MAG: HlyD family efflux transporter periplasmic adaptor subunit [Saprospiraceae bacterium]